MTGPRMTGPRMTGTEPPRLVADLGGTHAVLALTGADGWTLHDRTVLESRHYPTILAAIRHYLALAGGEPPRQAALAVAGPVLGDAVQLTNIPWTFSVAELT